MDALKRWGVALWARARRLARLLWLLSIYSIDRGVDVFLEYSVIVRREAELFGGAALTLVGLLNFESDKYCDGNTASYLSCTRPATYYYFNGFEIALVVIGVFLILIWYLRHLDGK